MIDKYMKTIKYFCSLFLFGTILLNSCMNDEPDFGQNDEEQDVIEGEGQVSFAAIKVEVNVAAITKGETTLNTDNYIVRIYSYKNNQVVQEYPKLSEMPEIITLEVGDYRIEALSHDIQTIPEWEKPYYKGMQTFTIKKDEVTIIEAIKCTFQNVKVTVAYSEDLKALLKGDHSVSVSIGEGNLVFNGHETRAGYFAAEGINNILIAKFQGTVDGEWVTMTKSFSSVRSGEYYNVLFDLEVPSIGDASLSFKLDALCENIKIPVAVNPGEEDILPEDKPDNPNQGNYPIISGDGFNITDGVELVNGETKNIVINIKAEEGIQNLKVVIDSNTLTPSELEGVGLSSQFDLAYPGDLKEALEKLGFPTGENVIGKKAFIFDLTQFTSLLGLLGSGTHDFNITVIDMFGNMKSATLTMITIVDK